MKETPSQVFSCEFFEILLNIFLTEELQATISTLKTGITRQKIKVV